MSAQPVTADDRAFVRQAREWNKLPHDAPPKPNVVETGAALGAWLATVYTSSAGIPDGIVTLFPEGGFETVHITQKVVLDLIRLLNPSALTTR